MSIDMYHDYTISRDDEEYPIGFDDVEDEEELFDDPFGEDDDYPEDGDYPEVKYP